MGELRLLDPRPVRDDLVARGLASPAEVASFVSFLHVDPRRTLIVIYSVDRFTLEEAHASNFGVREWRHVSVSVKGALDARLRDQKRIGRQREGGERSPAPLPDWYDLTHIVYGHPELGFDPGQGVWQYLPAPGEKRLNIAEALHLRQPK